MLVSQLFGETAVLELEMVRVVEVDRLAPTVVDDSANFDALRDVQSGLGTAGVIVMDKSTDIKTSSQMSLGITGTDEPPGMMPKRLSQPPRTPPACFSISSFSGMPMASSTVQGWFTWPEMQ